MQLMLLCCRINRGNDSFLQGSDISRGTMTAAAVLEGQMMLFTSTSTSVT